LDVQVLDAHASVAAAASPPPSWGGFDGLALELPLPHAESTKTPAESASPYAAAPFAGLVVIVMVPSKQELTNPILSLNVISGSP
jgi:hypothetical protein